MIHFFAEDLDFDTSILSYTSEWVIFTVRSEGYQLESLNFIFCSDSYLLEINREYLQHDYFTDVITFDNRDSSHQLDGDIFISLERVKENADLHQTTFLHELLRVIIHGVLHLLGFDDKGEISQSIMRNMEDKYLNLYFKNFHKST